MKIIRHTLRFILIFLSFTMVTDAKLDIKSEHAILIQLDEEKVLYEKNSEIEVPMASLTKLMTALVAIENIKELEEEITISKEDLKGLQEANAAVAGFRINQNVTYRDLLYGLLLPSGADAAAALTRTVFSSKTEFINKMNEKASSLGLNHTHFVNATGLDEPNHYSTAKEMSIIFKSALQNPELKKIIETDRYTMSDNSFSVMSTITKNIQRNHLKLDYLTGGKTGTTDNAGLCLASIANYNGVNYMLVTIKAPQEGKKPNNFYDAKTIYDYYMTHFANQMVIESGEKILTLNTTYAKQKQVDFYSDETVIKYLPNDFQKEELTYQYEGETTLTSKLKENTQIGTLHISYKEERIQSIPIILTANLKFDYVSYFKDHYFIVALGIILILGIFSVIFRHSRKQKKKYRKKK